jgi:hypothetical protein
MTPCARNTSRPQTAKRSLVERRRSAAEKELFARKLLNRPAARDWHSISQLTEEWSKFSSRLLKDVRCCCFCGVAAFAGTRAWRRFACSTFAAAVPPYVLAQRCMAKFTRTSDGSGWFICEACSHEANHGRRSKHVVFMSPDYLRKLLVPHPFEMPLLSVIDVRMDVHRHYSEFMHDP